jgi:hypothetical protein
VHRYPKKLMKKNVFIILILALFFSAYAYAGEWCCDDPIGVITEKVDPTETCKHMWGGELIKTREDYLSCALDDIFHSLYYPFIRSNPNPLADEIYAWDATISAIPRIYEQYPGLRPKIRSGLLKSLSYLDKNNRATFDNIMSNTSDASLWQTFVSAVDGKEAGNARVFYQFCPNYIHVVEYIARVHDPTLDELVEGQEIPQMDAFNGTIRCVNAQANIFGKVERLILEDGLLKYSYLGLLESQRIRNLRNTIYAKHGRAFSDNKIANYFKKKNWYKINAGYSDSLLTSRDKANLTLINTFEKNQKAKGRKS